MDCSIQARFSYVPVAFLGYLYMYSTGKKYDAIAASFSLPLSKPHGIWFGF